MTLRPLFASMLLAFALAFSATAQDAPKDPAKAKSDKPAAAKKEKAPKAEPVDGPRYPKQFNRVASLSDEQKKKLQSIAEKTASDKSAIDARAKQEYLGVLTDEQRKELATIEQGGAGKKATKKPDVQKTAKKQDAPKPDAAKPEAKKS